MRLAPYARASAKMAATAPFERQGPRLAAAFILASAIFIIDTYTQLSSAVAVLYVLVLLIVGDVVSRRGFGLVVVGCVLLTTISFGITHGVSPDLPEVLRLIFSLAALGVTAILTLRNAQARLVLKSQARLLDVTHDAIFTSDAQGRVAFWNQGAQNLYGWSAEEALGRDPHALLDSRFPQPLDEIRAALDASGRWEGEIGQTRRDGDEITVLSRWSLERKGAGSKALILETNTDITARKVAAEALHQSEVRYRTIFDTLAISIWEHDFRPAKAALNALRANGVTDMRGYLAGHPEFVREVRALVPVTDVNRTALRMMGVSDKGEFFTHLTDFLPDTDESFEHCLVALDEGHPTFESEARVRTRGGEMIPVIVALSFPPNGAGLDRIQASVLNITERQRMQERLDSARSELEQALRAATLGELSASIAHEVNQPISAVRTYADAALRWLGHDPPNLDEARAAIEDVALAARHTSEVVKRVRNLIRSMPSEAAPMLMDPMASEAARLVQRDLGMNGVTLELDLQAPAATLTGDRVLLQQTLINLMMNSVQAMASAESPTRALRIRTRVEVAQGVIEIEDTGPGFSADAAERAFDAFFTTKASGMGLGLAICRSTIEAHEGKIGIVVRSGGATVRIALPLAAQV